MNEMMPVQLTITVAKTPVKIIQKAATPAKAVTPAKPVQLNITVAKTPPVRVVHKTPVKAATPQQPVTLSINIAKTPVIVQRARTPLRRRPRQARAAQHHRGQNPKGYPQACPPSFHERLVTPGCHPGRRRARPRG